MATATNSQLYDFIIIGGDLSGLLIAQALEFGGLKVGLIDENETMGGSFRPFDVNGQNFESNLGIIKSSPEADLLLKWLEDQLGKPVIGPKLEISPLTFEGGTLKTFMGFGDRKFDSLEILNQYNQNCLIELKSQPDEWIKYLAETFIEERIPQSIVTKLNATNNSMEVTINGARTLIAEKVIYTPVAKHLLALFPENQLSNRLRQRLAKSRLYTSVNLHCLHKESAFTASSALHFLYGAKDEFEPTLGRFFKARYEFSGQTSVWMGLLNTDLAEDSEAIANLLREMKKQIKRAYPEFFENLSAEKIVVNEGSHGVIDLGLKVPGIVPEQPNLFLANHTQTGLPPLLGSIMVARLALEWALGSESGLGAESPQGGFSN
ncbi:MAG: NAD(P)-binding protein [Bdellovibrionales bacterium]|nr:NAD(P)-binding protein [Bdellovibrionales bacterium]